MGNRPDKTDLERRRYFALQAQEENEQGARRYFDLVRDGKSEEEARAIVKQAFKWGENRLNNVLTTRAGAFGPGTIAEFEAVATNAIRRSELAAQAELRFYYGQLDDLEKMADDGERYYEVKYTEGESAKLGSNWKSEKLPIREAQALLLQKISDAVVKPVAALKMFRADTVINLKMGADLSGMSLDELDQIERELKGQKIGKIQKAHFTEVRDES